MLRGTIIVIPEPTTRIDKALLSIICRCGVENSHRKDMNQSKESAHPERKSSRSRSSITLFCSPLIITRDDEQTRYWGFSEDALPSPFNKTCFGFPESEVVSPRTARARSMSLSGLIQVPSCTNTPTRKSSLASSVSSAGSSPVASRQSSHEK
jgi:hypothetical protein